MSTLRVTAREMAKMLMGHPEAIVMVQDPKPGKLAEPGESRPLTGVSWEHVDGEYFAVLCGEGVRDRSK